MEEELEKQHYLLNFQKNIIVYIFSSRKKFNMDYIPSCNDYSELIALLNDLIDINIV